MEACNAYYYATRDPLGARRRLHHRARDQPDVRRNGRRGAGRLLDARGTPRQTRSMPSLGRAAGRWPRMRCGSCARAGFAGEVHLVETSPVLREAQASGSAGRPIGTTTIEDACPRRRCCSSPTNSSTPCRSGSSSTGPSGACADGRRRPRLRSRRRDRRDLARRAKRRCAIYRPRLASNGGVALIIDYGHARSATGRHACRRCAAIASRPCSTDPGEQDLTAHVDFEALARAAREAGAAVTPVVTQGEWLERSASARGRRR